MHAINLSSTDPLIPLLELKPRESLQLVSEHDPRPLLLQLQSSYPRRFEWHVLQRGPKRFRVEVRRRKADTPITVQELLERDHHRLDALLAKAREFVEEFDFDSAGPAFREFRCGLERHIAIEQELLFPVFERAYPMKFGPTQVMLAEHAEITRRLWEAEIAIDRADALGFEDALVSMVAVLSAHNQKEEHVLYQAIDDALSEAQSETLALEMQRF